MKKLVVLMLLLSAGKGFAQRIDLVGDEVYFGRFLAVDRPLNYDEVAGSPYLNEDLQLGYMKFKMADSIATYFRYNIYTDEMEYLEGEKLLVVANAGAMDHLYFNGHTFVFTNYYYRNSVKMGYLELLTAGTCNLYIKYNVAFEVEENAKSSYESSKPPTFTRKIPQYYYSCYKQPINEFDNDKDGLKVIGNDYYDALIKYVKANKLKLRKTEDLQQLFAYYNSLLN
jgi:hypothetical protein